MSVETIISFLAATALVVVLPGPNILLIVNDSIKHGFRKSLFTVAGISQKLFNSSKFSKRSEFASGIIFLLLGFGLFFTQKEDFIGCNS